MGYHSDDVAAGRPAEIQGQEEGVEGEEGKVSLVEERYNGGYDEGDAQQEGLHQLHGLLPAARVRT